MGTFTVILLLTLAVTASFAQLLAPNHLSLIIGTSETPPGSYATFSVLLDSSTYTCDDFVGGWKLNYYAPNNATKFEVAYVCGAFSPGFSTCAIETDTLKCVVRGPPIGTTTPMLATFGSPGSYEFPVGWWMRTFVFPLTKKCVVPPLTSLF